MNFLKQKVETIIPTPPNMSTRTKIFIQKICYKKTASVDMTRHGFVNDKKLHPINLLLKPLREQLEKILGKRPVNSVSRKRTSLKKGDYKVPEIKTNHNQRATKKSVQIKNDEIINKQRERSKERATRKRLRKIKIQQKEANKMRFN